MTCRQPARTEAISEGILKLSDLQLTGMRDAAQQRHTVDTFFRHRAVALDATRRDVFLGSTQLHQEKTCVLAWR